MFNDYLLQLYSRIVGIITDVPTRICIAPNPEKGLFVAEKGLHLLVGSPQPYAPSGAGRWGYKVQREVTIVLATSTLLDRAGDNTKAIAQHLQLETLLIDATHDGNPNHANADKVVGITAKWVGGGSIEIAPDRALSVSSMAFEVTYTQQFTPGPGAAS